MSEIQPIAISETLKFFDNALVKAKITIDGQEIEKDVSHTVLEGDTVSKYVYLDVEKGLITRAALLDAYGREWYVRQENYMKGVQGYTIVFPLTQKIEVITRGN